MCWVSNIEDKANFTFSFSLGSADVDNFQISLFVSGVEDDNQTQSFLSKTCLFVYYESYYYLLFVRLYSFKVLHQTVLIFNPAGKVRCRGMRG